MEIWSNRAIPSEEMDRSGRLGLMPGSEMIFTLGKGVGARVRVGVMVDVCGLQAAKRNTPSVITSRI